MIRIVKTTRSRRPRDNGRFALIIGRGAGTRMFHLSSNELKQLSKAARKAESSAFMDGYKLAKMNPSKKELKELAKFELDPELKNLLDKL